MDMSNVPGDVGSPHIKNHIKIDDRNVDALGGPAAGGGMFGGPGFGFGGLGAGLGLGVLGGAALGGYGGYGGCGYGGGGYGAGLGSPLGVGFVGFGLAELAAVTRNEGLRAEIGAGHRSIAAASAIVGRDVLLTQTQIAGQEGRSRELALQNQLSTERAFAAAAVQQARDTGAIIAAIDRVGCAIGGVVERGFAGAAAQVNALGAQTTNQANSLSAQGVAQANALSAQVAGLQCLEQRCCEEGGTGRQGIRDDIAAAVVALRNDLRALAQTVCGTGTQANVNAAAIAAGLPVPGTVPFPGGACAGTGIGPC